MLETGEGLVERRPEKDVGVLGARETELGPS